MTVKYNNNSTAKLKHTQISVEIFFMSWYISLPNFLNHISLLQLSFSYFVSSQFLDIITLRVITNWKPGTKISNSIYLIFCEREDFLVQYSQEHTNSLMKLFWNLLLNWHGIKAWGAQPVNSLVSLSKIGIDHRVQLTL